MERLDGAASVPAPLRGGIVALGNFDGFHRGHQAVVGRAIERARAEGRPAIVATFDPHPMRYFRPDTPPFRLTTLDQRQRLFAEAGADAMLVFGFDAALAGLPARAFAEQRLVELIGAGGVVTGADFTFGKGRDGDVAVLHALGEELGFSVDTIAPVAESGDVISSSLIREALQAGKPREAAALLTRPFAIQGVVEPGAKLGRELGFPTANLQLGNYLPATASMRCAGIWRMAACSTAPPISASARASTRWSSCSNLISSISRAISMARPSRSS
jgi:riboflavin kinase / FMN adenylyltransferase